MRKMSSEVQVLDVDHRNVYVEAFLLLEMNRNKSSKDRTWSAVPDALLGVIG